MSAMLMIPSPFISIPRSYPESDRRKPIFAFNNFESSSSALPSPRIETPPPPPAPPRRGEGSSARRDAWQT